MAADISFASFNLFNFQQAGGQTYRGKTVTAEEYQAKKNWIRDMRPPKRILPLPWLLCGARTQDNRKTTLPSYSNL